MKQTLGMVLFFLALSAFAQSIPGVDESCVNEWKRQSEHCGGDSVVAMKECWRQRLSPNCFKMAEPGTGVRDTSCRQELEKAAMPCTEASITRGKQCMEQSVSVGCNEQIKSATHKLGNASRQSK
jgi:hypothetical protein